jgi:hypothetical protein
MSVPEFKNIQTDLQLIINEINEISKCLDDDTTKFQLFIIKGNLTQNIQLIEEVLLNKKAKMKC